jgi:hypothetical protein
METFDSLLALLRRTTDDAGWLQPLLDDPDSAAVLGAAIQVFARLGISIPHNIAQGTLSDASGGQVGTSSITVKRASGTTTGTIPAGYPFVDPRGCKVITQLAVVVTTQTQFVIPVQTLRETELVNTEDDPGFAVDPSAPPLASSGAGGVLMAPVAVVVLTVTTPGAIGVMAFTWAINNYPASAPIPTTGGTFPFPVPGTLIHVLFAAGTYDKGDVFTINVDGSVTFVGNGSGAVTQTAGADATTFQTIGPSTPIQGGAADYLSVHGSERGVQRQPGESTADYRQRIRNIPDAVSPIPVAQTVQVAVQKLGLPPFLVLEPFNDGATPALKAKYGLSNFNALAWDSGDFFDDPGSGLVMLDRRTATAYFSIEAQDYVTDPVGFAMFWDDSAFFDDPVLGYMEDVDVFPPAVLAALLAMIQDVGQKKAGGVNFDVYLAPDTQKISHGSSASAAPTQVFTMTPTAGTIWYVSECHAGHDSPNPSAAIRHHLVFDLEDTTTLTTADYFGTDTQSIAQPHQRVTAIHGFVTSDGAIPANLVAWVDVLEMKL